MHVPNLRVLPTNPYNTLLLWVFFVCGYSSMLLAVCAQVGQGDRVAGGAVASGPQAGLLQLFLRDTRLRRSGSVGGGHEPAQSECWGCRAACVRTRFFCFRIRVLIIDGPDAFGSFLDFWSEIRTWRATIQIASGLRCYNKGPPDWTLSQRCYLLCTTLMSVMRSYFVFPFVFPYIRLTLFLLWVFSWRRGRPTAW